MKITKQNIGNVIVGPNGNVLAAMTSGQKTFLGSVTEDFRTIAGKGFDHLPEETAGIVANKLTELNNLIVGAVVSPNWKETPAAY